MYYFAIQDINIKILLQNQQKPTNNNILKFRFPTWTRYWWCANQHQLQRLSQKIKTLKSVKAKELLSITRLWPDSWAEPEMKKEGSYNHSSKWRGVVYYDQRMCASHAVFRCYDIFSIIYIKKKEKRGLPTFKCYSKMLLNFSL